MNARQTTAKHATTMLQVLTRMQAAANTIPNEERINWGHAEQMHDALKYAVYAAFAAMMPQIRGIIVGVLASLDRERACDCDAATNGLTPDPPHDLVGPG